MKEQWVDNLRSRLSNHKVEAPKGLLDDIRKEMAVRGIAPTLKSKPKSGLSGKQMLFGSAILAGVIASAYVLWHNSKHTTEEQAPTPKSVKQTVAPQQRNIGGTSAKKADTPASGEAQMPISMAGELYIPYADRPFMAPSASQENPALMPDNMLGEQPSEQPTPQNDAPLLANEPGQLGQPAQPEQPQQSAEEPAQSSEQPSDVQEIPQNPAKEEVPPVTETPPTPAQKNTPSLPLFSFGIASGTSGLSGVTTSTTTWVHTEPHKEEGGEGGKPEGDTGGSEDIGGGHNSATGQGALEEIPGEGDEGIGYTKPVSGEDFAMRVSAPTAGANPAGEQMMKVERTVKHNQPIRMGFTFGIPVSRKMSLITGFTYNMLSSDFTTTSPAMNIVQKQKLYYLGLPVSVNYNFLSWKGLNVYGIAGGIVEKLVHGKLTGTTTYEDGKVEKTSVKVKESRPQFSVNASLGASYTIWRGLSAYIEPGFSYYFNNGSSVENFYKDRKAAFNLNVGLRLNIFKW